MCYNCGCHIPEDNMGHKDNITNTTLEELSAKWEKPLKVTQNILLEMLKKGEEDQNVEVKQMFEAASLAWGQSIDDAKKNTLDLLRRAVKK